MSRKSARFIADMLANYKTKDVYDIWKDMGLVVKDRFGDWVLTEAGRACGGKMSSGNRLSVPTFDADLIINKMIEFCKQNGIK